MISYDDECEKLAEYFLWDHKFQNEPAERGYIEQLAQHIQDAVEVWILSELP